MKILLNLSGIGFLFPALAAAYAIIVMCVIAFTEGKDLPSKLTFIGGAMYAIVLALISPYIFATFSDLQEVIALQLFIGSVPSFNGGSIIANLSSSAEGTGVTEGTEGAGRAEEAGRAEGTGGAGETGAGGTGGPPGL